MEFGILFVTLIYALGSTGYIAYFFTQKKYLHKAGFYLLSAAFMCHTILNMTLYIRSGQAAMQDLGNTLSIAAWAITGIFILLRLKFGLKILGAFAAPLATFIMVIVFLVPGGPKEPNPIFSSHWVLTHVILIFTGEAAFALAFGAGIMYLLQEHAIKSKSSRFIFKRLPSLDLIDTTGYSCIVTGFVFLTAGLVMGIVYGKLTTGVFWNWTPKEIWSAVTWVLYAILLHGRLVSGWHGKRAAIMAIVGFCALLFTFFGINLFVPGHHGDVIKPVTRQDMGHYNIYNDNLKSQKRSIPC